MTHSIGIDINPEYIEICKQRLGWSVSSEFEFIDLKEKEGGQEKEKRDTHVA